MSNKKKVLPKFRFQQFKDYPKWSVDKFENLIIPIEERAGKGQYTLMSVTSGVGLIPQIEKFGREIAGSAYKNYYVIQEGDFAYNKSATKQFPEGYISMLLGYEEAALPNSIFTCFRIIDKMCDSRFFDHLFHNNYHGAWLRKYIEVGSRAHGSLNVKPQHLWAMPVALPSLEEQQKIADCLSSLDELISAEVQKLVLLKAHKKGLLQKMFPAEGETVPKLRFPEFCTDDEWEVLRLGDLASRITTRNRDVLIARVLTNSAVSGVVDQSDFFDRRIANPQNLENYFVLEKGDYVYNPRISTTAPVGPISRNNTCKGVMSPLYTVFRFENQRNDFYEQYFKTTLWHSYLKSISNSGARHDRMNISSDGLMEMPLPYPSQEEQERIADCLSSLDGCITGQTANVEALQSHKKGLMQGLFPTIEEVTG